jgi:hypothetical protein
MDEVTQADVLEGARNLVRYGGIQADNEVLLLVTDKANDPVMVRAFQQAVDETGANLSTLLVKAWSRALGQPPRVVPPALAAVDVVILQGQSINAQARYTQEAMYEHGTNLIINMARTPEALGSEYGRYPLELFFAIGQKMLERVQRARRLRLTTKAGTDISMSIHPRRMGGYFYHPRKGWPGQNKAFPGGEFGIYPEDPCNGVVAVEGFQPDVAPPQSILDQPLMVTVKDHWAVGFEGPHADWLQDHLDRRGDDYARLFCEVMWGIHPRAGVPGCRAAANPNLLHVALGNFQYAGGRYYSKMQLPMYVWQPTVTLDDEPILLDGQLLLLQDPELRELASRYGDPDQLLAIRPVPKHQSVFGG